MTRTNSASKNLMLRHGSESGGCTGSSSARTRNVNWSGQEAVRRLSATETCSYCERATDLADNWNDVVGMVFGSEGHLKKQFAERDLPQFEPVADAGFDFGALLQAVAALLVLPCLAVFGLFTLVSSLF